MADRFAKHPNGDFNHGTTKGMRRDVRLAGDGIRSQNTGVCACHQCVWTSVAKQADDCS